MLVQLFIFINHSIMVMFHFICLNNLKKLCNQYFKTLKFIFAYESTCMHDFFCFKDRVSECLRLRVVYKFTCRRCNSSYACMTNRHMQTSVCEHMGISPLTQTNVKRPYDHLMILLYYVQFLIGIL